MVACAQDQTTVFTICDGGEASDTNINLLAECTHCIFVYQGQTVCAFNEQHLFKRMLAENESQHLSERIKQHILRHLNKTVADHGKRRRGRHPKQRAPEEYQSVITCHLVGNGACRQHYPNSDLSGVFFRWTFKKSPVWV